MVKSGKIVNLVPIVVVCNALACGLGGSGGPQEDDVGVVRIELTEVPGGIQCVLVSAQGSRTTQQLFAVSAGTPAVLSMSGLPIGPVTFSGAAFIGACSTVTSSTTPDFVADPVTVQILPSSVANVSLFMHRNGRANVSIDFEGSPPCGGAVRCPTTLVSGLHPSAIAVDGANVYWTDAVARTVAKCAANGCGSVPTLLAEGQANPRTIVTDGINVYWQNDGANSLTDGSVSRCSINGCAGVPETIMANAVLPDALAVDATNLYFAIPDNIPAQPPGLPPALGSRLMKFPVAGGQVTFSDLVAGTIYGIATNGQQLAVIAAWGGAAISTKSNPTSPLATLTFVDPPAPFLLTMDTANVYWATHGSGTVMKCSLAGCAAPTTLVSLGLSGVVHALATDGVNVYWSSSAGTIAVMRCSVDGCSNQPDVFASGPAVVAPGSIAVDATSVYWADGVTGAVMKAAK